MTTKKKRIYHQVDFAVTSDHREIIEESEKLDKYVYLEKNLKTLWNIKVTVIFRVIETLETVKKENN